MKYSYNYCSYNYSKNIMCSIFEVVESSPCPNSFCAKNVLSDIGAQVKISTQGSYNYTKNIICFIFEVVKSSPCPKSFCAKNVLSEIGNAYFNNIYIFVHMAHIKNEKITV